MPHGSDETALSERYIERSVIEKDTRVCGVICEFDPFHQGHAYLLDSLRRETACDFIVCAMSGHFTQRGQPALLPKWVRAEMALRCGADIVFELPTLFALRDAQRFALGGVALLSSLGVVTHLGFGSECGDIKRLREAAYSTESPDILKQGLNDGQTVARARARAADGPALGPNDTLAVEYLRALYYIQKTTGNAPVIEPITVRRAGSGHHDGALAGMASATAIRAGVHRGEDVSVAMPAEAHALLQGSLEAGAYQLPGGLDGPLLAMLRAMRPEALAQIADVSEGLENRLLRAGIEQVSRQALLAAVKCKRYTWARLSRVLSQAQLGITKELTSEYPLPVYARLLGLRERGRPLMAAIRRQGSVPVVTRPAKFRGQGGRAFALDLRATDLWALGCASPACRVGGLDLVTPAVRL